MTYGENALLKKLEGEGILGVFTHLGHTYCLRCAVELKRDGRRIYTGHGFTTEKRCDGCENKLQNKTGGTDGND